MNAIQQAAKMDMKALNIDLFDEGHDAIFSEVNGMGFVFYRNTKVFNLGEMTIVKSCQPGDLTPTSNWSFSCFPEITNVINSGRFNIWKDDDAKFFISNDTGDILMTFISLDERRKTPHVEMSALNERRKLAKGWENWKPNLFN